MADMVIGMEALREYYKERFPIYAFMGLEIVGATPTSARCSVPLTPANVNHFGTVHAAIQWAVCETLGGVIFLSNFGADSNYLGVVRNMSIKFLKPATTALVSTTVIAEREMARVREDLHASGRTDFQLSIDLKDTRKRLVATATANYHARDRAQFCGLDSH